MRHILKCSSCGDYSLRQSCPKCGSESFRPGPAKWNPSDPYGKYRRYAKSDLRKEAGLL